MDKDTFYFSHDYNSRTDPKIKKLLVKHGLFGYGIFWAIIEDLYNNANALPLDYDIIAYDLHVDKEALISVINDFYLFTIEGDTFSSNSVEKRLEHRDQKSEKARQSALKRWERNANASKKNANALRAQSDSNAIKERKGKDNKENRIDREHTPEEMSLFEKFTTWINDKAPRIGKFEQPFKIDQYLTLKKKYSSSQISELLLKMENSKELLKKNISAYRTFLNWMSREDTPGTAVDMKPKDLPTNLKKLN